MLVLGVHLLKCIKHYCSINLEFMIKFLGVLFLLAVFLFPTVSSATVQDTTVYTTVEIMPEPPGGVQSYMRWLENTITYSEKAYEDGVQGQILTEFVVEKNGRLSGIRVLDSLGYGIEEEVVNVLAKSRLWSPGIQSGRPCRVLCRLAIKVDVREVYSKKVDGDFGLSSQSESDLKRADEQLDVAPEPPGGASAFLQWIGRNYRYPKKAIDSGVKGQILVRFIVERDGAISDIKVVRDLGHGTGAEAVRVLRRAPKWSPGIQNGRPVRVLYDLPINLNMAP